VLPSLALATFVAVAALLWASVVGYPLALGVAALMRRRRRSVVPAVLPPVAVVVPTLNEADHIDARLADLARSDYPADRLEVLVVDGGSTDGTPERVQAAIAAGARVRLARVTGGAGQPAQVAHGLAAAAHDIVVVTDADARLEPACIRRLVEVLVRDPSTAVVGAAVRPASPLLEERVHWWFLNLLWWLEGEALSSAIVSGVCYAVRRSAIDVDLAGAHAADARIALASAAHGWRVRVCRDARATELRVPGTRREQLRFRRRRGADYIAELIRAGALGGAPAGWRIARRMRLWNALATPRLGIALGFLMSGLLATPHWPWVIAVALGFAVPPVALLLGASTFAALRGRWWRLPLAAGRLAAVWWISLLSLPRVTASALGSGDLR
jgi:cellulose synthase/poly-beta-1,6-N-acetylglucosamine synthase-like glycosyltransferase